MIKKNSLLLAGFLSTILSLNCKDKNNITTKAQEKTPVKRALHEYGNLTVTTDPSFNNLTQALVNMYVIDYPDVKITVKEEIEDRAIIDFYEGKIPLLFSSKPLTEGQQQYLFNKTKINYIASTIALDATIFITSVENSTSSISLQEIKDNLYKQNPSLTLVFDHPNSSNFNTVNEKLKLTVPKGNKVVAMGDSFEVINYVQKNKKAIGIIGLNILSDKGNPKTQSLLEKVKILAINNGSNDIEPSIYNLRNGIYPFYREVYILKNEIGFGIGAGLSRFAGSQRGQKIVTREGLQPYFLYKREVKINQQEDLK